MTDEEKRAKMTGRPMENVGNDDISESLHRVLDDLSGSLLKVTENLHSALSGLYTRDLESLDTTEVAALIDFQDHEDPGALVNIVVDEIKKYKDENEIKTLTVVEALDTETGKEIGLYRDDAELENPDIPACIFDAIMHRARERLKQGQSEDEKKIISVGAHRLDNLLLPVDKVNREVWNGYIVDGKRVIDVDVAKTTGRRTHKQIIIPVGIDFTELQKEYPQCSNLNHFDFRVLIVSDNLVRSGQQFATFAQIHDYIGYRSHYGTQQKQQIENAYRKLNAEITLDNEAEIKAGYKYPHYIHESGAILPNRRASSDMTFKVNGQETHDFIKILDTSPLLDFAIGRGQVAEVPVEIYQTKAWKDPESMILEDYFLLWTVRAMNGGERPDRSMSTIYGYFGLTSKDSATRKKKFDLRKKIDNLLKYYMELGQRGIFSGKKGRLTGYIMDDKLTLIFSKKQVKIG